MTPESWHVETRLTNTWIILTLINTDTLAFINLRADLQPTSLACLWTAGSSQSSWRKPMQTCGGHYLFSYFIWLSLCTYFTLTVCSTGIVLILILLLVYTSCQYLRNRIHAFLLSFQMCWNGGFVGLSSTAWPLFVFIDFDELIYFLLTAFIMRANSFEFT